jgi:hypothetical protein
MNTRRMYILGAIAVLGFASAISATDALAQQKSTIVGTWKVTSISVLMVNTNEVLHPVGDHPVGYLEDSPGGHMVTFMSTGTPKRPTVPYTDADRADIYAGIYAAYAGTYRVEDNKVIHHVDASFYPEQIGRDLTRNIEIDGNRLTIKLVPLVETGEQHVVTFERVE